MITDLREVNRLLFVFEQYKLNPMEDSKLLQIMKKSPVVGGKIHDHYETLDFCEQVGIIRRDKNALTLDAKGRKLSHFARSKNPKFSYELNEDQKRYYNLGVFLDPTFDSPIRPTITQYFIADNKRKTWYYDTNENPLFNEDFLEYLPILEQTNLIHEDKGVFVINPVYAMKVSLLIATKSVSPQELEMQTEQHSETGDLAEEYIFNLEKRELKENSLIEEANSVEWISRWNVAAGYDIESFSGPNKAKIHDKFIEVKGSTKDKLRFLWSSNEIKKAEELGPKYWIYFVPNVTAQMNSVPIRIQDPAQAIMKSKEYYKKPTEYEITRKEESDKSSNEK